MKRKPLFPSLKSPRFIASVILAVILVLVFFDRVVMSAFPVSSPVKASYEETGFLSTEHSLIRLSRMEPAVYVPPVKGSRTTRQEPAATIPIWQKNAVSVDVPPGYAQIAIIIDDVGIDRRRSEQSIHLPAPMTMAFLPYAEDLKSMVDQAQAQGHEIMLHMPMEPMNSELDAGPVVLHTDMGEREFESALTQGLESLHNYVGLNNHMGSRLTQDRVAMDRLMEILLRRGLLFIDSRTIATSVAAEAAKDAGVPYAVRDVFLDHVPSRAGVDAALAQVERIARTHGRAIAIGHPKTETIEALQDWVPTLADKKMALVPVSALIHVPPSPLKSEAAASFVPTSGPARP